VSAVLDIDRWSTRLRRVEPAFAQSLAAQMRHLVDRRLAGALAAATRRALAQAGLPPAAAVALRRLELALPLRGAVDERQLSAAWAATFADALATRLAGTPAGDAADGGQELVWFADHWAAEYRHLERLASGDGEAWWAGELAAGEDLNEELAAPAILHRWLMADGARALLSLASLATKAPGVIELLEVRQARELTARLLSRLTLAAAPGSATPATDADLSTAEAQRDERLIDSAWRALLTRHASPRQLVANAATASDDGRRQCATPWLLAALLCESPALCRLPAAAIARGVQRVLQAGTPENTRRLSLVPDSLPAEPPVAGRLDEPSPPVARTAADAVAGQAPTAVIRKTAAAAPLTDAFVDATTSRVFLAGLLLLLRPLQQSASLPAAAELPTALADLALLALRRVLAPLPRGEREVAEERERALLGVFAPQADWRERIASRPVAQPVAAERWLATLLVQIPADLMAVPGAERQVFGLSSPCYANEADRRLARLLLRPGELRVSRWQAELFWPLSAVDPALRHAGCDQDPGWLPWLGRKIVFHFGVAS
jgi:hypothetical protein